MAHGAYFYVVDLIDMAKVGKDKESSRDLTYRGLKGSGAFEPERVEDPIGCFDEQ